MFDLPFLREVQSIFNGLVLGGLIVAFGRYLAGAPQSGLSFPTAVRVHLGILAGLFLLKLTFGILGGVFAIFFWLLWKAIPIMLLGLVIYLVLRIFAPETAKDLRDKFGGS